VRLQSAFANKSLNKPFGITKQIDAGIGFGMLAATPNWKAVFTKGLLPI